MPSKKSSTYRDTLKPIGEKIDDAIVSAVFLMDNDDDLDLDTILVSLAEARAYLIKAQLMAISADNIISIDIPNDQPRMYADEVSKSNTTYVGEPIPKLVLPKVQPQGHAETGKVKYKRGITAMFKKAIEFECPSCDAEAGTFCFKFDGPGAHPNRLDERNDGSFFHKKRADLAIAHNNRIRKQNIAQ